MVTISYQWVQIHLQPVCVEFAFSPRVSMVSLQVLTYSHSQKTVSGSTGHSKLAIGVNGCLLLCCVGPVTGWDRSRVYPASHPRTSRLQPSFDPKMDKQKKMVR